MRIDQQISLFVGRLRHVNLEACVNYYTILIGRLVNSTTLGYLFVFFRQTNPKINHL